MIYKHKNDRDKDIQETIPNLHINLEQAIETHTIRDTGVVPEFNGIETPSEVGSLIRDRFQAIDETNRLAQLMRQVQQSKSITEQQSKSITEQQSNSTTVQQ